jgi:hypothetical protein
MSIDKRDRRAGPGTDHGGLAHLLTDTYTAIATHIAPLLG